MFLFKRFGDQSKAMQKPLHPTGHRIALFCCYNVDELPQELDSGFCQLAYGETGFTICHSAWSCRTYCRRWVRTGCSFFLLLPSVPFCSPTRDRLDCKTASVLCWHHCTAARSILRSLRPTRISTWSLECHSSVIVKSGGFQPFFSCSIESTFSRAANLFPTV